MAEFGYKLCSEEHPPSELVRLGREAESHGYSFAMISDHFHPWVDAQGESSFVWSVLGALSSATKELRLGTGVTCPTTRIHPALVAQAAATIDAMAPGRFSLGLGTGENLNEHIFGDAWPGISVRREKLREAVEVIRRLWSGKWVDHRGQHFRLDDARLYTTSERPPPILIASSGDRSAEMAAEIGDGIIGLAPNPTLLETFDEAGGRGRPRYAEVTVCWGDDEADSRETVAERWPNAGIPGEFERRAPTTSALRAGGRRAHRRSAHREDPVRARCRSASRRRQALRGRGIRPHLVPSGGPGSGWLPQVLCRASTPESRIAG